VCRLSKQETAKGCVATCGELWVERNIQFVKSNVKYRTTSCPEKLYVHDRMVDEALTAMQHDDSLNASVRTAVKSVDELVPRYRANIRSGPSYDTGDDIRGTQLIGKGKKLKQDAFRNAMQHEPIPASHGTESLVRHIFTGRSPACTALLLHSGTQAWR